MSSSVINSIGLLCDIAGVVILFYFGPPTLNITREGYKILPFNPSDDAETKNNKALAEKHYRFSQLGLGLLFVGFVLQLVSNLCK